MLSFRLYLLFSDVSRIMVISHIEVGLLWLCLSYCLIIISLFDKFSYLLITYILKRIFKSMNKDILLLGLTFNLELLLITDIIK